MFKLETFYRSDEWCRLREIIMSERTTADGYIICESCGEPIFKRYDCIAHHKIELTEDNVNDANVSLNPDNIELIHFKCHNRKHQRFDGFCQRVYLVYGSPCSGKSTFVNDAANGDDLILDVDRIWDAICNDGRYKKVNGKSKRPNRVKANVFGVRDCIIDMIKTRTGMWRNAYIIGGYPLKTERERLCDLLRAEPIFIDTPIDECIERAKAERPEEWQGYVQDWFDSYIP